MTANDIGYICVAGGLTILVVALGWVRRTRPMIDHDYHEIVAQYDPSEVQRAKAEQLAAVEPWIKLFQIVATVGLFLWFWLTAEAHDWKSAVVFGAIAYLIAVVLSRILAGFVGAFLGRRYARELGGRKQ